MWTSSLLASASLNSVLQLVVSVRKCKACMGQTAQAPPCNEPHAWDGLAKAHKLHPVEVELLMSCKVVHVEEFWQVEVVRAKLQEAHDGDDTEQITKLLCSLVRATVMPGVCTGPLADITLRIALRQEECVSLPMASCVRLARVLACKLDALGGLSYIYDE